VGYLNTVLNNDTLDDIKFFRDHAGNEGGYASIAFYCPCCVEDNSIVSLLEPSTFWSPDESQLFNWQTLAEFDVDTPYNFDDFGPLYCPVESCDYWLATPESELKTRFPVYSLPCVAQVAHLFPDLTVGVYGLTYPHPLQEEDGFMRTLLGVYDGEDRSMYRRQLFENWFFQTGSTKLVIKSTYLDGMTVVFDGRVLEAELLDND